MSTPLVDIIIVRFNTPELDVKCVTSLIEKTNYAPYHITLYDNSINKDTLSYVWNRTIKSSFSHYVCLLNNDTEITDPNWLLKMMDTMLSTTDTCPHPVGAVGPSTNNCGNIQKIPSYAIPKKRSEIDMEEKFGKKWQLSGFCLLLRRSAWVDAGWFSEAYTHYGQENELLHKMQKIGYRTIWRKDAFVYHVGEASSKKLKGFNDKEERRKADALYQAALKNIYI